VVEKLTHRNGEGKHQPPAADEVPTSHTVTKP
jgi:hypothetical protein